MRPPFVAKIKDKAAALDSTLRNSYALAALAFLFAAVALLVVINRGR